MKYDVIIIGGGAAGLFCGANLELKNKKGLILDKSSKLGLKLLVSGSGQCNFTHGGDIRDFVDKYGDNGKKVRGILYKFSNEKVVEYFEGKGLKTIEREDGKVFPQSLCAEDVRSLLLREIKKNGFEIKTEEGVVEIRKIDDVSHLYEIKTETKYGQQIYRAENIVVAAGGISYPKTGSDGSIFKALESLEGIEITPLRPSLVPIYVEGYGYTGLSGIAIRDTEISLDTEEKKKRRSRRGDVLFTHRNLSGPAIIDFSRYLNQGDRFRINYVPDGFKSGESLKSQGVAKSLGNYLLEETGLPKAFIQEIINKVDGVSWDDKTASVSGKKIKEIQSILTGEVFLVNGKAGLDKAMATAGGVALSEISTKTMESKKHPGLFFCGEVLDVDGDTGGYNIQFAFSSGYLAAQHISQLP